jgi:hypothetical protein
VTEHSNQYIYEQANPDTEKVDNINGQAIDSRKPTLLKSNETEDL